MSVLRNVRVLLGFNNNHLLVLEHMSSMQTSAQSIFAIASHDQGSEEDGKTMVRRHVYIF